MKLIVKKLQGGECTVDVHPTSTIMDIKKQVAEKLNIPVADQKLLLMGRTLLNEQFVQSYPFKDGSKLNLVVKATSKPEPVGLYEVTFQTFKKLGLSDLDASAKAKKYIEVIEERFKKYSWDDIERLAEDCIKEEYMVIEENMKAAAPTS